MADKETIGRRLTELRGERSREKVAYDNGISVAALVSYELGTRVPRDEVKVKLATYYGVSVETLFFKK